MRILKFTSEHLGGDMWRAVCVLSDGQTATCLMYSAPSLERLQNMLDALPDIFQFHGPD
jgi:hypothetical protein